MKPTVYLETSIISYVASRPSRDLIVAANQLLSRQWWQNHRGRYDLFASQAVIGECGRGDAEVARERLALLHAIPVLA